MRKAAIAAVLIVWLPVLVKAQEHTNRWELTEDFIRNMWLHPVRALNVTVLGPGPVHTPADDCEIHIGAELEDTSVSDFPNIVLEPSNVCKNSRHSSKAHNLARLKVETLDSTKRCSGGGARGEPFRTILGRARARSQSGYLSSRAQITKLYALEGTDF